MTECWNLADQLHAYNDVLGILIDQWTTERRTCARSGTTLPLFLDDAAREHKLPGWIKEVLHARILRIEEMRIGFERIPGIPYNHPTVF